MAPPRRSVNRRAKYSDIDLKAYMLAEPSGKIQRAGPAHVVLEVTVQLGPEGFIVTGPLVFFFQLMDGPHQGLRHILPSVRAETPVVIRCID